MENISLIIMITVGIIATAILSVLVDWLIKNLLPEKPRLISIIPIGAFILCLICFAVLSALYQSNSSLYVPTIKLFAQSSPTPSTHDNQTNKLNGVWDVEIDLNQIVSTDGVIKEQAGSVQWVIELSQSGNSLSGEFIGAKNGGSTCTNANITGAIQDNSVNFTVTYLGSCCPNESMIFTGLLESNNNILTGKIEPVNIPKSNCTLWYADVTATKRSSTDINIPSPTQTQSPSKTIVPTITATEFVPPEDGILFQDNFDDGIISAEWTTVSGTWIIADGTLTALNEDDKAYVWISLKKPYWQNYVLSLNVNLQYQGTTWENYAVVTIRNNTSQSKIIGVPLAGEKDIYWAFIGNSNFKNSPIANNNPDAEYKSGSKLELEARGDTFTLRVNERKIQSITLPGYEKGGISLGVHCRGPGNCPSFDNILVTYLPD